jgi:siroheme synthase
MSNLEHFHTLDPRPKLTVVGAGPGDPDLITVKAIKALKSADVVLYDALIADELLDYCKAGCYQFYDCREGVYVRTCGSLERRRPIHLRAWDGGD